MAHGRRQHVLSVQCCFIVVRAMSRNIFLGLQSKDWSWKLISGRCGWHYVFRAQGMELVDLLCRVPKTVRNGGALLDGTWNLRWHGASQRESPESIRRKKPISIRLSDSRESPQTCDSQFSVPQNAIRKKGFSSASLRRFSRMR